MMFHPDDPRYRQLSASEEADLWAQHAEAAAFAAECAREEAAALEEEECEMARLAAASERAWRVVL